jgi:DNA-binding SARP family transcriptional activator/tetratricopeptide (TPR) repeat protein
MRYEVLGPLRVLRGETEVDLGRAGKPRQLLMILIAHGGRPVPVHALIASLWPHQPPPSARRNLQLYAYRLRCALGADAIDAGTAGYVLRVGETDVDHLARLAADGRAAVCAGDTGRASLLFRQALDLWRGDAYQDLADCDAVASEAHRLHQLRLAVAEQWAEAELSADTPAAQLVVELVGLTERSPYHEGLRALLMRALARGGRRAEALRAFSETRARLREELGVEPGPVLQGVHESILRGEVAVMRPVRPQPAQLPRDVVGFAGRSAQLAELDALVRDGSGGVLVISGTAGVGKTALAVHWAHRNAARFPDGQLHVDLRGFDPDGAPVSPDDALRGLLDALLGSTDRLPDSTFARTALLRSVLAHRRVLLLLDNARDPAQVRPLLPGAGGSLVVVTSRHQLDGLGATHNARLVALHHMPSDEARELLAHRLGAGRVAAEPDAVDDIIARCARLPLALAVVAARATAQPAHPLRILAAELSGGLDGLGGPDAATDLRSVFGCSYRLLAAPAARLFRLLGLPSGPDLAAEAAAALAGEGLAAVRARLGALARAHLLDQPTPGRYVQHDLLRAYAAELVSEVDGPTGRSHALSRLLDHYLHTAYRGVTRLYPHRCLITLTSTDGGLELADADESMAWFVAEHANLLAAIDLAERAGFLTHAWQLTWAVLTYLDRRGFWADGAAVSGKGLAAAERLGDRLGQAHSQHALGAALTHLGRLDEAQAAYAHAIDLFASEGHTVAEAHSHLNRALVDERQGDLIGALSRSQRCLDLCNGAGHRSGQAKALNAVGWYKARLGRPQEALADCERAVELVRELGDQYGEALTWDSLGYVHTSLDHLDEAIAAYERSVQLWQRLGDHHSLVSVLHRLGDAHRQAGQTDDAGRAWQRALTIHADIDHPEAAQILEKLRGLQRRPDRHH